MGIVSLYLARNNKSSGRQADLKRLMLELRCFFILKFISRMITTQFHTVSDALENLWKISLSAEMTMIQNLQKVYFLK